MAINFHGMGTGELSEHLARSAARKKFTASDINLFESND